MNGVVKKKFTVVANDEENKQFVKDEVTKFEKVVKFEDYGLSFSWTSLLSGYSMEKMLKTWKDEGRIDSWDGYYYPRQSAPSFL